MPRSPLQKGCRSQARMIEKGKVSKEDIDRHAWMVRGYLGKRMSAVVSHSLERRNLAVMSQ